MSASPEGPPTLPPGVTAERTDTGLEILEVEGGRGARAKRGSRLSVAVSAWLTDGTPVPDPLGDESREIVLGETDLAPGLEEGLAGVRAGAKRRLIVPSDLAYGPRGRGAAIPPYATLIFDVEVLAIR